MAYGDILIVGSITDKIYRYSNGSWDSGFATPSTEGAVRGITVDPTTGDILIVGTQTDKVYKYSNGSWDSGFAVPSAEDLSFGIAIDHTTGDILLAGGRLRRIHRYSNGSWDSGFLIPPGETTPFGLTVDLVNGDILIVGSSTDKVYRYSNGSWDSGFLIPSGETFAEGIAIDSVSGDILIVGLNTDKVYRYSNGSWDSGFAVPSKETSPQGIAFDSYNPNVNKNENINISDIINNQITHISKKHNVAENISIADSINIQVVYGSEVIQQEFNLLSRWYTAESFTKTWLIPEDERPVIDTKLTPSGETRELVSIQVSIFGTLTLTLSSDVTGSVTGAGDDLSTRFESDGHVKISASNGSVTFALADASDLEEPYILENRIPGNAFFNGLSTVNRRQSSKLILSDGDIIEAIDVNESINIHEAIVIGIENFVEDIENILVNEEVVVHILKNFSEDIGIQDAANTQLVRDISESIVEQIGIQDAANTQLARNISGFIAEQIGIQDAISTLVFEPRFNINSFNSVDLDVYVLAFITSGAPEGNGTVFRTSSNLGSAAAGSDLELQSGQSVTRIALDIQGAGNIRLWDNPSDIRFNTFFNANPNIELRLQFSHIGPAYTLTKGNQGSNFSNWSTANSNARTAIRNARVEGQKFILALVNPSQDYANSIEEQINIQDAANIQLVRDISESIAEQIDIQDAANTQLARNISESIAEQIGIQDAANIQLVRDISESITERIGIQDAANTQLVRNISGFIAEQIGIQDVLDTLVFEPKFNINSFNSTGFDILVLALITSSAPEGDGTIFRTANGSILGSASADSDLEIQSGQSITRIALEISGDGTLRLWDNPSGIHFSTFFNDNPDVELRLQFSHPGPAYTLTRGGQGGNFSNWSTSNSDARTAIRNARAEGQRFLLALGRQDKNYDSSIIEQINIADLINISTNRKLVEQIGILDLINISISRKLVEQLSIQEAINIGINKNIIEQISIQDIVDIRSVSFNYELILEQIGIQDTVNVQLYKAAVWPTLLPQSFSLQGYSEEIVDNRVVFKTTYGSGMRRPRYTFVPEIYKGSMLMSTAEWDIFKAFYINDLEAGKNTLLFPINSTLELLQFSTIPSRVREKSKWRVSLSLRTI